MCLAGWLAGLLPSAHAAEPEHRQLLIAGQPREYRLLAASSPGPHPLVLLLHGHLGTAANALGEGLRPSPLSAWREIAAREPLSVAALQGLEGADHHTGWHDCRGDAPGNPQADDVAFASQVAARLVAEGRADPARIHVMGMSNGAMMTLRLALEMSPAPAAVAAVAGTLAATSECNGTPRPVSVLLIHGTSDPLVPYGGGAVGLGRHRDRGEVLSVAATRDFWLGVDGLMQARPDTYVFPHESTDITRAVRQRYGADGGPQVTVITIEQGGHVEPSRRYHYGLLYSRLAGLQNRDFEAAEEAWAFFRDKRLAAPPR